MRMVPQTLKCELIAVEELLEPLGLLPAVQFGEVGSLAVRLCAKDTRACQFPFDGYACSRVVRVIRHFHPLICVLCRDRCRPGLSVKDSWNVHRASDWVAASTGEQGLDDADGQMPAVIDRLDHHHHDEHRVSSVTIVTNHVPGDRKGLRQQ